ncbi:uncharacterized protein B0T23DRAFT_378557 [Neurospora hispaniola]|uniref:Uncharacterized protein n=1 Tax=Neurospora hispaniola TaxID=588809 RepID=A0AAJ0IC11_9PEZI|nr:hypothetical protein B0T23DRAFT_378557 [Neurospora hispaniola]
MNVLFGLLFPFPVARLRVTVPRLYPTIRLGLFLMKGSDSNVAADNGGDPRRLRTPY